MGSIINRSNHPVSIKRIGLKVWTLRDEIELAVAQRLKEAQENGTEPDISDLQEYYGRGPNIQTNADIKEDSDQALQDDGLDTAGNPMDEDAADMMAAMQGGAEESEDSEESEESEDDEKAQDSADEAANDAEDASESSEEDDEATAMALAMLADQGIAPEGQETDEAKTEDSQEDKAVEKEFKRTPPQKEKVSDGFFLISDINMDYVLFFSKHSYLQGQTVALEFQIPKKFIITCEILKAEDIDRVSKIISTTKPNYRIQAILTFNQPGERSNLREFLKSIEPEIPPPPSKLKKPQGGDDDDDDEFEDLGF